MSRGLIIAGIVLILGGIVAAQAIFIVPQQQQALVTYFGEFRRTVNTPDEADPGLHFKIPFAESVVFYERRVLNVDPDAREMLLAGQERLEVDAYARYQISDPLRFFQRVRTVTAAEARMADWFDTAMRNTLGGASQADVIYQEREKLTEEITRELASRTPEIGVNIIDARLRAVDLPQQIRENVFRRMISERQQVAAEIRAEGEERYREITAQANADRTVLLAEAERESAVMRGEGDQAAIEIYGDAYGADPQFFDFYRSLEAYRRSLSDGSTTLLLAPDSDFFRYFSDVQGMVRAGSEQ